MKIDGRDGRTKGGLVALMAALLWFALPHLVVSASGPSPPTGSSPQSSNSPVHEYPIGLKNAGPLSIAEGQGGVLWVAEYTAGSIAEFLTSNDTFRQLPLPEQNGLPAYVTVAPDGAVWFSDQSGTGSVWKLSPGDGSFVRYPLPAQSSYPVGVLVDPAGNVWFAEDLGNRLGELVYPSYSLSEYQLPQANSGPAELAMSGSGIWITESTGDRIAMFNTTTHSFKEYVPAVPLGSPVGIVLDKSGGVWISEHGGSSIVRLNPATGVFTKFPTSPPPSSVGLANSAPATLVMDRLGRLWFVEHFSNRVGRLDPSSGKMDEFGIPGTGAYSVQSLVDSHGNFWFTVFSGDMIGTVPGNATVPLSVAPASLPAGSFTPGQSGEAEFEVTNNGAEKVNLTLQASATFSQSGSTASSEASLDAYSLSLAPGESAMVIAYFMPPTGAAPGPYAVGVSASSGNLSTVASFVISVAQDQVSVFVYQTLPDLLTVVIVLLLVGNFFIWAGPRKRAGIEVAGRWLAFLGLVVVGASMMGAGPWAAVEAKCPGLPGLGSSSGGPSYFTIVVLVVQIAILVILAYFFLLGLSRRRNARQGTGFAPAEGETEGA